MMKRKGRVLVAVGMSATLIAAMAACGSSSASVEDKNTAAAAATEKTVTLETSTTPTTLEAITVSTTEAAVPVTEVTPAPATTKTTETTVPATKSTPVATEKISIEKAKEIILADLGVASADFVEVKNEPKDNEYEFEVVVGDYEYDYDINFYTGKIVDKDVEKMDAEDKAEVEAKKASSSTTTTSKETTAASTTKTTETTVPVTESAPAATEKISLEKAKEIALADLEISGAKLVETDFDDGNYELEFWVDGVEYSYEINAKTGKIVDKDVDYDD